MAREGGPRYDTPKPPCLKNIMLYFFPPKTTLRIGVWSLGFERKMAPPAWREEAVRT